MFDRLTTMLAAVALLAFAVPAFAQDAATTAHHVQIKLLPEKSTIQPNDTFYVAVEQTIEPGWHTYWENPGDSGEAPALTWTLPAGFAAGPMDWPLPKKIPVGPLANYGYDGKVTLLQQMVAPATLPEGPVVLKAQVDLLVCSDQVCIPETTFHEITFNDGREEDNSALIDAAYDTLPMLFDWPAHYGESDDGTFFVTVSLMQPQFVSLIGNAPEVSLLPRDWGLIDNAAPTKLEMNGSEATFRQKRGDRPLTTLGVIEGVVTFTDAGGNPQGFSFKALPPAREDDASAAAMSARADTQGIGGIKAIIFAFIGGLILNLMPCVFPVLSLKALKLCRLSGKDLAEARLHGVLYTLGILASFAVFAGVLVSLRAAGAAAGWGFHLQNPAFVLFLAYLLFVIGLNLSGMFEVPSRLANFGGRLADGHGHVASFFTGVLAALVATPCTAPFMATALGFALTQNIATMMAIFMSLGLGLAFPYLMLSFVPALQRAMPKPGAWMDTFRNFLAFPMFAAAAWLVWVYGMQGHEILFALMGCIALAFALWTLVRLPSNGVRRYIVLAIVLAALASAAVPAFLKKPAPSTETVTVTDGETKVAFSQKIFDELISGNGPVFVNMTAAWCITCKVNERTTLSSSEIKELFADRGVVFVEGDWTSRNPEITEFLAAYGRNGVPIYVYYAPRDPATGRRPAPQVLPQILTPALVRAAVGEK